MPETNPSIPDAFETVATVEAALPQMTLWVKSCVLPSEKVPVAVSRTCVVLAIDGLVGVSAKPVKTALVMVTLAVPLTSPTEAAIVAVPTELAVASPGVDMLNDTTPKGVVVQLAEAVTSMVVASEYTAVAVNAVDVPKAIVLVAGLTSTRRIAA